LLDDDTRKKLGFAFGTLVTGPMQAAVTHSDEARQQIALDLKDARISLPFLGWEKGPGVPATATFVMEKTAAAREITDFQLSGKGFEARGKMTFLAREDAAVLEKERQMKQTSQVTTSSDPNVQEFRGADYMLTGRLEGQSTRTSKGISDYVLYTFRFVNVRTTEIVYEDSYEIKKQGLEDASYR